MLRVIEQWAVTRALLGIARNDVRDRGLAEQICRACVEGLDVHGAAISLLTASPSRETLWASDPTAELRISFLQPGSWSLTGSDALDPRVSKQQPTMNFGWLTRATPGV